MNPRVEFRKVAPGAVMAMSGLGRYLSECGLESSLLDLVRLRASQINGCAYCIDAHTKDARQRRDRTAALRHHRLARDAILHRA
jgi:AhpD family alkylhydroperoxidase